MRWRGKFRYWTPRTRRHAVTPAAATTTATSGARSPPRSDGGSGHTSEARPAGEVVGDHGKHEHCKHQRGAHLGIRTRGSCDIPPRPVALSPGDYVSYPGDAPHVFDAQVEGTLAVLISELR
jgi:hypothetical protein